MTGKNAGVSLFGCLFFAVTAWGCDCTHFPITPTACLKPCQTAALFKSNQKELTTIFGLDDSTAKLLLEKRDALPSENAYQLKQAIPADSFSKIAAGIGSVSAQDASHLAEKYKLNNVNANNVIDTKPRVATVK